MGKVFSHLKLWQRDIIERDYYIGNFTIEQIAKKIKVHKSTISRELKRGQVELLNSQYKTITYYKADVGQRVYKENKMLSGRIPKFYQLNELYIEDVIYKIKDKLSPYSIYREQLTENKFDNIVHFNTIYNYVKKGYFKNITMKDLPYNNKNKNRLFKEQKSKITEHNIIFRPEFINNRSEPFHWEIDSVIGTQESKKALLVFTERKTNYEIIKLLSNHNSKSVVEQINKIEEKIKKNFLLIFKSFTTDNGSEFKDYESIVKSINNNKKRTEVYYCNAYKATEKAQVERNNRIIRKYIPKYTDIDIYDDIKIKEIQDNINKRIYRKKYNGKTSEQCFKEELIRHKIDLKVLDLL